LPWIMIMCFQVPTQWSALHCAILFSTGPFLGLNALKQNQDVAVFLKLTGCTSTHVWIGILSIIFLKCKKLRKDGVFKGFSLYEFINISIVKIDLGQWKNYIHNKI